MANQLKTPAKLGLLLWVALLAGSGGCLRQIAVNALADTLASNGAVFASDNDPQLVRDALPFSLKLMEAVLAETPDHQRLLLATSSGFTQYAYAFVQQDADELETRDIAAARALQDRARKLYLRARDYGLRSLDRAHAGISTDLHEDPGKALSVLKRDDVPLLYWTAAAWGSAISISKNDPNLVADQVVVEAMLDRALELDETFDHGAIHAALIGYEPARQGAATPAEERSRRHFERAVELTQGQSAAPYVSYAEAIMLRRQDRKQFEGLLRKALAIDVDARPRMRLANLVMQRRATWLLSRMDELFVE